MLECSECYFGESEIESDLVTASSAFCFGESLKTDVRQSNFRGPFVNLDIGIYQVSDG